MSDTSNDPLARVADLEARVEQLEAVQELLLRLLSTTRPLAGVLEQYGATKTQEQAFYQLLDGLADRTNGPNATGRRSRSSRCALTRSLPSYAVIASSSSS